MPVDRSRARRVEWSTGGRRLFQACSAGRQVEGSEKPCCVAESVRDSGRPSRRGGAPGHLEGRRRRDLQARGAPARAGRALPEPMASHFRTRRAGCERRQGEVDPEGVGGHFSKNRQQAGRWKWGPDRPTRVANQTEAEALLAEQTSSSATAALNIRLRDDKSYHYIAIRSTRLPRVYFRGREASPHTATLGPSQREAGRQTLACWKVFHNGMRGREQGRLSAARARVLHRALPGALRGYALEGSTARTSRRSSRSSRPLPPDEQSAGGHAPGRGRPGVRGGAKLRNRAGGAVAARRQGSRTRRWARSTRSPWTRGHRRERPGLPGSDGVRPTGRAST